MRGEGMWATSSTAGAAAAPAAAGASALVLARSVMISASGDFRDGRVPQGPIALARAFRYLGGMNPSRWASLVALSAALASSGGCGSGSKTPALAYQRFSAAVQAGDGGALFDSLDGKARWAWMSVQKWHRE